MLLRACGRRTISLAVPKKLSLTASSAADNSFITNLVTQYRPISTTTHHKDTASTILDKISKCPLRHPVKGDLVYSAPLGSTVKGVKFFSISTSLISFTMQPYLFLHSDKLAFFATAALGSIFGFFIFVTPVLIHWMTKKYVTDLYFNKESKKFTAATYNFFVRRREMQFSATDVIIPDVPGIFTSIVAKNKPLFVDPKFFLSKDAYTHLMGFDKPLKWKLD